MGKSHAVENFYPRLGGMHLLISSVGAVGALMSNTGLEDILSSTFARVPKLLNGKKVSTKCACSATNSERITPW